MLTKEKIKEITDISKDLKGLISNTSFVSQQEFNWKRGYKAGLIVNDFLTNFDFKKKKIIEFGPGHYSFSLIARYLGAEVVCFEKDDVFYDLGEKLNFKVVKEDFTKFDFKNFKFKADLVFAKGVYNAYNYSFEEINQTFKNWDYIVSSEIPVFFTTVNKGEDVNKLNTRLEHVDSLFVKYNFTQYNLDEETRRKYALNYSGFRNWKKNL